MKFETKKYVLEIEAESKRSRPVDTITYRIQRVWQKPQMRRRIKWGAVSLLLLNLLFGAYTSYFITKPEKVEAAEIAQYSGGLLVFADTVNVGTPKYKTFDDTTGFGVKQSAQSVGTAAIKWMRVAASPTNDEWIIVTKDAAATNNVIKAQVCTGVDGGVSCGTPTTISSAQGTALFRNFDVAYEQTSGDALLVYSTSTIDTLRKIEWTGGAWTGDAAITLNRTSGTVEWVELTARPGSNQIGIAYSDTNDDVSAFRWSGTAVGDEATSAITTVAQAGNVRKFDVSFEGTSGDMLVASPTTTAGTTAYGQLSGTTWTIGTSTPPDVLTDFMDLSEPGSSDYISMSTHGVATTTLSEGYGWNGSAISDNTLGDDNLQTWAASYQLTATNYFSSGTYYAVAVISNSTATDDIDWWTMTGTGTVADQTVNTRTRGAARFIDLFDYPNADKELLLTGDANSDLWADTWAGATGASAWTDLTSGGALETSLASATTDVIDFAFRLAPNAPPTITVSGTTDVTSGTVNVAFGGSVQGSAGITGGTWTITGVTQPAAGTIMTAWINDAALADESTAIGKYSGSGDMTNMVLNKHVLSIGGVGNQSIAVSDIQTANYDHDNNARIMHTANTSVLNVDGNNEYTDETINILTTDTLTVSGTETLTTVGLTITGTLASGGASTYNVAGNWTNNGVFTQSTSTVNFNGANSSTQIIGGSSNTTFNNFSASTSTNTAGRTIKFTDGSTTTVSGTWNITGYAGKIITLTRTSTTSAWTINPTAANVTYANVSWSNSGLAICATYSTDGLNNNANWSFSGGSSCNVNPNDPTSLVQKKVTGGATISVGGWTNENQVEFTATASDTDNPEQLQLCVEIKDINTAFDGTGELCGTLTAYSGTPITVSRTVTGITDATQYHWRARVKDDYPASSGWVAYGGNPTGDGSTDGSPANRDFGVDTTAPTGGTVKDGTAADQDYNDGSLTSISGNWTGTEPDSTVSGLSKYEYSIRRLYDGYYWSVCTDLGGTWQVGENWCNNATSTSFTRNGMNLSTAVTYYVSLKTSDNAGNTATISSNGQQVLPTLSFSISSSAVTFADLNNINNWTDTKTTTLTTSTNASSGYTITSFINQLLTSTAYPSQTIANFPGTWTVPQSWFNYCKDDSGDCGYGYTSSDTLVQGSNRFLGSTLYCAFNTTGPGDIVADHTDAVNGSTGAVSNEQFTLTHRVSVNPSQTASTYQALMTLIVTANF